VPDQQRRWTRVLSCVALVSSMLAPQSGLAQSYPSKPIRLIVPFAPGGNTDIIARFYTPKMAEFLGQQIIVDNRAGAGGTIGSELIAKAAPDGSNILMVSEGHTINPAMIRKIPYDSVKDFAPISLIVVVPNALLVHPSLPVKDAKQLVALARAQPDSINYSTAGRGTVGHLSAELLSSMTKTKLIHVPYKGAGQAIIDLVAGYVQMQFTSMPLAIQYAQRSQVRMIAQTGKQRASSVPSVPTMEESGFPGFVVLGSCGLFAPANTPRAVIDRLQSALAKALNDATVKDNLAKLGADVAASTPEDYDRFNRDEIAKWIKLASRVGITPE
jgi:tripartite-type tricarboxylate transporter receptor subunit TctC